MNLLIKKPSALLPFITSFLALVFILGYTLLFGILKKPAADEGLAAHIFQLLLLLQSISMAFFAFNWIPKMSKQAYKILVLHTLAALIPLALIFFLES